MWDMILFAIAGFLGGWGVRGLIDCGLMRPKQLGKPEMMWFNKHKSRWERVTEMQLLVADRIVAAVPVKLVDERKTGESR
jgi:hypothetical protein